MDELKRNYIEFLNTLDPFRCAYEDAESITEIEPADMLYNLIEIKKDWDLSDDIELSNRLDSLIDEFKKQNVKSSNQDDLKENTSPPLFTNDELLILSAGLIDSIQKIDEAAKSCFMIPDAYKAIEKYRNDLQVVNTKVLSFIR